MPEVLDENRFLASRDGVRANLIDPRACRRRPLVDWVDELLEACAPHAADLGCEAELASVGRLVAEPGEARQRAFAGAAGGDLDDAVLGALVEALSAEFLRAGDPVAS
jgi:carboxylate-amine ligase